MKAIVVDSSAILAILLDEPDSRRCDDALAIDGNLIMSAGTLAELGIVASKRGVRAVLDDLIAKLNFEIIPVTATEAGLAADAYQIWGRGNHPASLNFGDCFGYVLAKQLGLPLLFVGKDFSQTDLVAA